MARPKKVYQTPVIERVDEPVENHVETVENKPDPILIPRDGSIIARRAPTLEVKHVVSNLVAGRSYKIRKSVSSAIYGEFYLLDNGLYVSKVGNITVKE